MAAARQLSLVFEAPTVSIPSSPTLACFAQTWFDQHCIGWRPSTVANVRSILDRHLLPVLARHRVDGLKRADLFALRTTLATTPTPAGRRRSSARINLIFQVLEQILAERERQLGIPNPLADLRSLPARPEPIRPFTLPQLQALRLAAGPHWQEYVWIRGLTGLRSGEANGLRWDMVDLKAGTCEILRARVNGAMQLPKNQYSERRIHLLPTVREAFERQFARTGSRDGFVFTTARGAPIDSRNFARRDWKRLLAVANLPHRAPEQLRHTAATLALAAGEAPTFVARMLGHADCRMLMTTYARYMPDALGRADGSALQAVVEDLFTARAA